MPSAFPPPCRVRGHRKTIYFCLISVSFGIQFPAQNDPRDTPFAHFWLPFGTSFQPKTTPGNHFDPQGRQDVKKKDNSGSRVAPGHPFWSTFWTLVGTWVSQYAVFMFFWRFFVEGCVFIDFKWSRGSKIDTFLQRPTCLRNGKYYVILACRPFYTNSFFIPFRIVPGSLFEVILAQIWHQVDTKGGFERLGTPRKKKNNENK